MLIGLFCKVFASCFERAVKQGHFSAQNTKNWDWPLEHKDVWTPLCVCVCVCVCVCLTEVDAQTVDELKQLKGYSREKKRQYKELKEVMKKHNKKTNDLINEHASKQKHLLSEFLRRRSTLQKRSVG